MATDLVTSDEFLAATGQTLDDLTPDVGLPQVEWAILSASAAVRSYTDRKFELQADADQSPRQFKYEGGLLEIDDAQSVTSVSIATTPFAVGRTLDPVEWYASAIENPDGVFDTIELFTRLPFGTSSPAMGFTYNLDNYFARYGPVIIEVDAVWGWPEIPQNVKAATVITANVDVVQSDPSALSAESIGGYSRSFSNVTSATGGARSSRLQPYIQIIPIQAIALLDPYLRMVV